MTANDISDAGKTGKTLKRPVARKGKRGMSARKMKAIALMAAGKVKTQKEAAAAVGYSPANASRTLGGQSVAERLFGVLQSEYGVSDAEIVAPVALHLRAVRRTEEAQARLALSKQPELFESLFDVKTGGFKKGLHDVEPDLELRAKGHEMAIKLANQFDPERVRKIWDDGVVAGGRAVVPLLRMLEPHLSPEGLRLLHDGIKDLAAGRLVG